MHAELASQIDVRRLTSHRLIAPEARIATSVFRRVYSDSAVGRTAMARQAGPEGVVLRAAGTFWQLIGTLPFVIGLGWFRLATDPPSPQQNAVQVLSSAGLLVFGVLMWALALVRYQQANLAAKYLRTLPPPPVSAGLASAPPVGFGRPPVPPASPPPSGPLTERDQQ